MAIGLIIIGDEIMSGKRADQHFRKVVEILGTRGLQLGWAEYLGDEPERIAATLRRTFAGSDIVFSCGGIGATPDDHTRQCAATALGVPLMLHPEAKDRIMERTREMATAEGKAIDPGSPDILNRLKMGEFPANAQIIPNPFNRIPGFYVENPGGQGAHYFLPGFPVMAWPMIEWVLDTRYPSLFHQRAWQEKSVLVYSAAESTLTPMMESIEAEFMQVKVFSLPHVGDERTRRHIELGVKGDPQEVELAYERMLDGLRSFGMEFHE